MICINNTCGILPFACVVLVPVVQAQETVIAFDKGISDTIDRNQRFGTFGDGIKPEGQFITARRVNLNQHGFLRIRYLLEAPGAFNGWTVKTCKSDTPGCEADWSAYRNGDLVVRLRKDNPGTKIFKLEIKTNGGLCVHSCYVRILNSFILEMRNNGYADIHLPLAEIVGECEPLTSVSELSIVFEEREVSVKGGTLYLAAIRLVK